VSFCDVIFHNYDNILVTYSSEIWSYGELKLKKKVSDILMEDISLCFINY